MLSANLKIVSANAETIISSLKPETCRELPRTHVEISGSGNEAYIRITAHDATAMRAALNSYLGCISITEDISRIAKVN